MEIDCTERKVRVPRTKADSEENSISPLARTLPASLPEQIDMKSAMNGGGEQLMKGKVMGDSRWNGWIKMRRMQFDANGRAIDVHYWHNPFTGQNAGFKFSSLPYHITQFKGKGLN